jgi:uncharacterized membrane protein YbhN (UPF0104 family)
MTETSTTVPPAPSDRGVDVRTVFRRGLRFYSSPRGQERFRRATDVVLLVPALVLLVLLAWAYPPASLEQSLSDFLDKWPSWLDPVWGFFYDVLWLWALVLLVAALVARRMVVTLQALGSLVLAVGIAVVTARLATGDWPDLWTALKGGSDAPPFPALRVTEAAAVIVAVAPHLVRPLQRAGRWLLAIGFLGALFLDSATPTGNLAAILVAFVAAAAIRLAFGTSIGRPGVADVRTALAQLGVSPERLEAAERQVAGVFTLRGSDAEGRELLVKVYGRDAYDNRLLAKLWRTLWYRDGGPRLGLSRGQTVEHEALVTLLARNASVPSREVVTAGATAGDDALLVLRGAARSLAELDPEDLDDSVLRRSWKTSALLGAANIAHLGIDPSTIVLIDGEVGLVDFTGSTIAPTADQLLTDRAQLLTATATAAGGERALAAAVDALGAEDFAALLPYLQPAAFGGRLRQAVKTAELDVDEFRRQAAEAIGVEPTELVKLRRVTVWSLIQAGLLVLAASAVIGFFGGIDFNQLWTYLSDASWGWLILGLIVAQLPRLTQAVATLGSVPVKLPDGPVYAMQLTTSYMNLALPSYVGRMAVNIRFFQRQGLSAAVAVTSGAIDSFAGTIVQAVLLGLLLLFSESSLSVNLSAPDADSDSARLLWIILGAVVLTVLVGVCVGRIRRGIVERWQRWWPQVRSALGALRASNKLILLFGGNLATELLFAIALGLFVRGIGFHVSLPQLLVINISVSLLASFIPVPGGIGVTEFGLTAGLTAAGVPEEAALAAVILYRISTFYLPPVWGFFAMRWLQRNRYL